MQKMATAQFKAQCFAGMGQVSQSGRPVVITKRRSAQDSLHFPATRANARCGEVARNFWGSV